MSRHQSRSAQLAAGRTHREARSPRHINSTAIAERLIDPRRPALDLVECPICHEEYPIYRARLWYGWPHIRICRTCEARD